MSSRRRENLGSSGDLARTSCEAIENARTSLHSVLDHQNTEIAASRQQEADLRDRLAEIELEAVAAAGRSSGINAGAASLDSTLLHLQLHANLDRQRAIAAHIQSLSMASALLSELESALASGSAIDKNVLPTIRTQMLVTEVREQERTRLAREVHDGPAQVMLNAIYGVRVAEEVARKQPMLAADRLRLTRELLVDGASEIRRFMFDLHPVALADLGLPLTLQRYGLETSRLFGIDVRIDCDPDIQIAAPDLRLALFRIAQEAIRNAQKHAGEHLIIEVHLTSFAGILQLTIRDNGIGFDPTRVQPGLQSGAGLILLRERAASIGGEFRIESAPGAGTLITVSIPHQSAVVVNRPANRQAV